MTASQLTLIFGPLLVFALVMAFITRNDPVSSKAINEARKSTLIRVQSTIGCIFIPIGILIFINNLFGSILLIISGLAFVFHNKLFRETALVRGVEAYIFGLIYIFVGLIMVNNA